MIRQDLSSLLVDETIRRWLPPEDLSARLPLIPKPQTDAELAEFFATTLGLRFPAIAVCPGHSSPWAALCDAYFARSPVVVIKASRGFGGKTFLMGALAWAEALTLRADVTLLGGSGEQAVRVHEYLREFWRRPNAPQSVLASDPAGRRTELIWGNKVTALMASMASVSGPHPQRLRVDEIDVMDLKLLDQALGQPMDKGGVPKQVLLSSAHYEADGTLTEILRRARANGWRVHEYCWKETLAPHGWVQPHEIASTRSIVTAAMWQTQYDLQEPSPEGRAIDPAKVERMFLGPRIDAGVSGGEFPYREFEPPIDGARYCHGGDWARTRDYVEIVTFRDDVDPIRLVAYQRFTRRATPYILGAVDRQTSRYPGALAHDATSLGGKIMSDLLQPEGAGEMAIEDVDFGRHRARQNLFTDYIIAIESEEVVAPRVGVLYDQYKFCTNDDLRPGGSGHPPDGFVAGALAYKASMRTSRPLRIVSGTPAQVQAHDDNGTWRGAAFLRGANGNGTGGE